MRVSAPYLIQLTVIYFCMMVILIKPEDPSELARSINELLSNPGRREKMGANGRQFILAKYDRVKLARNIADLCQEMAN